MSNRTTRSTPRPCPLSRAGGATRRTLSVIALLLASMLVGCSADQPLNPSFPVTVADAQADLERMKQEPVRLQRPVVVIGGFMDIGMVSSTLCRELREATGDDRITGVALGFRRSFESCRCELIKEVQAAFGRDHAGGPIEVDVVGLSMGGLVARCAAAHEDGASLSSSNDSPSPQVHIVRLITISTPHRGAVMAKLPALNDTQKDMRAGSAFLQHLDASPSFGKLELYPYVRLGDSVVGPENAAPPGRTAWWVANRPFESSHLGAYRDPRIIADIARRLRGETPFTTDPPAPLPTDEK